MFGLAFQIVSVLVFPIQKRHRQILLNVPQASYKSWSIHWLTKSPCFPTAMLNAAILLGVDYPRCPPHIITGVSLTGEHNSSNDNDLRVSRKPTKPTAIYTQNTMHHSKLDTCLRCGLVNTNRNFLMSNFSQGTRRHSYANMITRNLFSVCDVFNPQRFSKYTV